MSPSHFSLQDKVRFLSRPGVLEADPGAVEAIETHFAWVFLTRHHAFKLKKPMRWQQMDYRHLNGRERGCREELRLNRRLAPDVYEDVIPLRSKGHSLSLSDGDCIEDWLLRMRRLSPERMLSAMIPAMAPHEIAALVDALTRFFRNAESNPIEASEYILRLRRQIELNFLVLHSYPREIDQMLVSRVARAQLSLLERARSSIGPRGRYVVEGHGDLRVEHVHLGPPVVVIDCMESDRDLRLLDPAEDFALMAFELDRAGAFELSQTLTHRICAELQPSPADAVFGFYKSLRAAARAKVSAWHLEEPAYAAQAPFWSSRAESCLADALRYAQAAQGSLKPSRPQSAMRPEAP